MLLGEDAALADIRVTSRVVSDHLTVTYYEARTAASCAGCPAGRPAGLAAFCGCVRSQAACVQERRVCGCAHAPQHEHRDPSVSHGLVV